MHSKRLLSTGLILPLFFMACADDVSSSDTDGDTDGTSTGGAMTTAPMTTAPMTTMSADSTGTDTTAGDEVSTTAADTTAADTDTTAADTDTGMTDTAGETDTGTTDTGMTDTGMTDTGMTDTDTGMTDTGMTDTAGETDTGMTDTAGETDTGIVGTDTGTGTDTAGETSTSDTGTGTGGGATTVICSTPAAVFGPDLASPPAIDTINVPALDGFVGDVDVFVDVSHTWVSDVEIELRHVDTDTIIVLADDQCGQDDDLLATFDDQAAALPACGGPPAFSGDVLPLNPLSGFIGIADGTGDWEITVRDDEDAIGGTLNEWCIELTASDSGSVCGDGIATLGEECDGADLGGASCGSIGGFDGGDLACDPITCTFDTSDCSVCGDGVASGTEDCDMDDLGVGTCEDAGFPAGGIIACDDACTYDTSMCDGAQCGDGVVEKPEGCEGNELGGVRCEDEGFVGGTLDCNTDACELDTSECSDDVIAICSAPGLGLAFDGSATLTDTLSALDVGAIADVDVWADITHPFVEDVDLQVRHVAADITVDLVFDPCLGGADDLVASFNDEGNGVADCVEPVAVEGNLTPVSPLSALDGGDATTDWELIVNDDFPTADDGVLNQWCVYVTLE